MVRCWELMGVVWHKLRERVLNMLLALYGIVHHVRSARTRYFTLDFDRQIFYYAHSESRKSQVTAARFLSVVGFL